MPCEAHLLRPLLTSLYHKPGKQLGKAREAMCTRPELGKLQQRFCLRGTCYFGWHVLAGEQRAPASSTTGGALLAIAQIPHPLQHLE